MNRSTLNAALAAGLTMAASAALADNPVGIMDAQALKEISRTHCVPQQGEQATYGVRPHGDSWMLDVDRNFTDPPEKRTCDQATGSNYGILPNGQGWMVDYAGRSRQRSPDEMKRNPD